MLAVGRRLRGWETTLLFSLGILEWQAVNENIDRAPIRRTSKYSSNVLLESFGQCH